MSEDLAHSSIRFGLGRFNTGEEVDYVVARVVETVERLRELSPLLAGTKTGTRILEAIGPPRRVTPVGSPFYQTAARLAKDPS